MRILRDENRDNVYEVTIVATDTDGNEGSIHVTVVVDNVDEPGEVVFTEGGCRVLRPDVGSPSARPR